MSNMVVRTNVLAMNSHRNLGNVGTQQARASARLSSGFRINSAADDAAGLGISENMRAQIRGLDQASRNAQDGISLIQTAEGGLSTINEMIIRIRELTVQASNDINTGENSVGVGTNESNRARIQGEINHLIDEIQRTATTLQFNGMTLLDGSLSGGGGMGVSFNREQTAWLNTAANFNLVLANNADTAGLALVNPPTNLSEAVRNINAALGFVTQGFFSPDGTWNAATTAPGLIEVAQNALNTAQSNLDHLRAQQAAFVDAAFTASLSAEVRTFVAGLGDPNLTMADLTAAINTRFGTAAGTAIWASEAAMDAFFAGTDNIEEGFRNLVRDARINADTRLVGITNNADLQNNAAAGTAAIINAVTAARGNLVTAQVNLINNQEFVDNLLAGFGEDHAMHGVTREQLVEWVRGGGGAGAGTGLWLQIGANSAQGVSIEMPNIITNVAEELRDIFDSPDFGNVTNDSSTGAVAEGNGVTISRLLESIDSVLSDATAARGAMGALQNRLEFTIQNLQVSSENLSAANSRIRDADMAAEMMRLTQANVLQQAATAMLAQGNQAPQNILQLLG